MKMHFAKNWQNHFLQGQRTDNLDTFEKASNVANIWQNDLALFSEDGCDNRELQHLPNIGNAAFGRGVKVRFAKNWQNQLFQGQRKNNSDTLERRVTLPIFGKLLWRASQKTAATSHWQNPAFAKYWQRRRLNGHESAVCQELARSPFQGQRKKA